MATNPKRGLLGKESNVIRPGEVPSGGPGQGRGVLSPEELERLRAEAEAAKTDLPVHGRNVVVRRRPVQPLRRSKKPPPERDESKINKGEGTKRGGKKKPSTTTTTNPADLYVNAASGTGARKTGGFNPTVAKNGGQTQGWGIPKDLIVSEASFAGQKLPSEYGSLTYGDLLTLRKNRGWTPGENVGIYEFQTVNEALGQLMGADQETIKFWQAALSQAGFIGEINEKGEIEQTWISGSPDEETMQGMADFLEYALQRGGFAVPTETAKASGSGYQPTTQDEFYGNTPAQLRTGQDWAELLDERRQLVGQELDRIASEYAAKDRGGGGGGGGGVIMPDPAMVRAVTRQVAQLTLGRTVEDSELEELVARVQAGVVGADAASQDFDLEANLVEWLRAQHPAEAQAHDLVNTYSTFTDLIGPMQNQAARGGQASGLTLT